MNRYCALLLSACAVMALHGCSTTPVSAPVPVAPSLTLLDARPLVLADDCEPNGSYFVEFKVLSNGSTGDVRPPAGPACVQQALTAWVSSFRYAPPAVETTAGVEWLMVAAKKGS
jgi:hypothetical protein